MINWQGQYITVITLFCIALVGLVIFQSINYNKSVIDLSKSFMENCEKPKEVFIPINQTSISINTDIINEVNATSEYQANR